MPFIPGVAQIDGGGNIASQDEMDAIYYGQKIGTTGKTQAQLDAAANAADVATMTGQFVDPKTGYVVATKPTEEVNLTDKATKPAAPAGYHYTWIGGTKTGSWTLYKDAPVVGNTAAVGGGNGNVSGNGANPVTGKTIASVVPNGDGTNTVYYSDGSQETTGKKGLTQGAKDIVKSFLEQAGMGALADKIWAKWVNGGTADQIMEDVRNSPEYAARYPAMAALNKAGRNISEAAYIAKETADIELMKRYGIPSGIFDDKKYLGTLIENNVDLATLQLRLIAAQDTVLSYDTSIKDYAKTTYGLDDGHLMAWALDPTMALPVIQQQAKAIQIGGAALAAGLKIADITKTEAESLAAAGVTQDQAKQGFVNIAQMGQYKQSLPGANPAETVTNEDLINAQFATSPDAIVKVNKAKQSKLAEFAQGGQFAVTQAGLVGLGNAPVI
jgi:hypothetical protein